MKRILIILALCYACHAQTAANQLITLSANGKFLVNSTTSADTPVYITGDDAFLLATQLCIADVRAYLNDRQQRGYNFVWFAAVDNAYSTAPPANCNGDSPFSGADFTNFNAPYWAYVDTVVSEASKRGITLLFNVAFTGVNNSQGWFNDFNGSVSGATWTAYAQFLANRYKTANNIVWLLGGDSDIPNFATIKTNIGLLGTALAANDPNHLITFEGCRSCSGSPGSLSSISAYASSPPSWLKMNASYDQQANIPGVNGCPLTYSQSNTILPFEIEAWYEIDAGRTLTGAQLRQEGYWATLTGCYLGFLFGNGQIWPFSSNNPNTGNGTTPNWKTQLASPGSFGEEYLGQLMRTRNHWLMVPDTGNAVLTGGIGSGTTLNVAACASDGSTCIVYDSSGSTTPPQIAMGHFSGTVHGWWYNPQTGIATDLSTFANSGTHTFTAPDTNDWVLVLDLNSLNLGAPGTTAGLGVIAPSRAIDWTKAGLSAVFADNEMTLNPWTPPTRTQCVNTQCATVTSAAGSATPAQINAALANAPQATYVLLPPGNYAINANLSMQVNNVTLRGSGPMSTILNFSGTNTAINTSVCCNSAQNAKLNAAAYPVGTSTVTITSATCVASCPNLIVGNTAFIIECDQGFTGTPPYGGFASTCAGTYSDPYPSATGGGASPVWQCGRDAPMCNNNNAINGTHAYNQQNVTITNVTNNGGGSYTVNFTPGLYSADWSSVRNAIMWWSNASDMSFGIGIEDMTLHLLAGGNNKAGFGGTCNSWIKGNRIIVGSVNTALSFNRGCHDLFANNYLVASDPAALISAISEAITTGDATTSGGTSDTLLLNNIITDTLSNWGEGNNAGNVWAYNHARNAQQPDYQTVNLDHFSGQIFQLDEGNFYGREQMDGTHGTHTLGTVARCYVNGDDPPFYTQNPDAITMNAYQRFWNIIGCAIGGNRSTIYQNSNFNQGAIFSINPSSDFNGTTDPLALSGLMRWGNCDVINGGCRFVSGEVPTALTNNAAGYSNALPGNNNLPCTFFIASLANNASSPCVPLLTGGTGLSWWKVATAWSSFPASPTASTIQPFPTAGPELSGGPYVNGKAFDNPAGIAFKNLPIDTTFQSSFTVTASAWSNSGTTCSIAGAGSAPAPYTPCMVLTVSLTAIGGNVSAEHIMGGFQLVGAAAGCYPSSGISFTGRADNEIWMTSSSTTKIVYALASDPGANACATTMKYPDVRQFDERIYQADPVAGPPPPAPAAAMFASRGNVIIQGSGASR